MSDQATLSRPVSTADPFSHAFLHDPYPHHEALREAGPVVWLERYGIWAMARHEQVRDALTDWQTYCSSAGVGLSDFRKEPPWRPPSIILEADPPLHTRTRAVLTRILSPAAIKVLRDTFEREAEKLITRLVEQREFDGVADLAEAYPLKVFPDAVGISEEGRENLLPYGSMVFNSFGPRNDLFDLAMANAGPVRDWIMSKCSRAALAPGGLGREIRRLDTSIRRRVRRACIEGLRARTPRPRRCNNRLWHSSQVLSDINGDSLGELGQQVVTIPEAAEVERATDLYDAINPSTCERAHELADLGLADSEDCECLVLVSHVRGQVRQHVDSPLKQNSTATERSSRR